MLNFKRTLHIAAASALLLSLCVGQASAATFGAGTVTGDGLRLRAEANTGSSVLATANNGSHVVVLENAVDGWYKVTYQSKEGYMSAEYVDVAVKADISLGKGQVNTSKLNVRSGPSTESDKVTALTDGTVVTITGVDNGWYKIECDGKTGYVLSDYISLEVVAPTPAPAAKSSSGSSSSAASTGTVVGNGTSTEAGLAVVNYAKQFLGCPYVYGASGPNSFDCSGFTSYVYKQLGYSINRTASSQLSNGKSVSKDQLQPGDLVFFRNSGDSHAASHVGIYVGGDMFIHASSDSLKVEYKSMLTSSSIKKYVGARRIV